MGCCVRPIVFPFFQADISQPVQIFINLHTHTRTTQETHSRETSPQIDLSVGLDATLSDLIIPMRERGGTPGQRIGEVVEDCRIELGMPAPRAGTLTRAKCSKLSGRVWGKNGLCYNVPELIGPADKAKDGNAVAARLTGLMCNSTSADNKAGRKVKSGDKEFTWRFLISRHYNDNGMCKNKKHKHKAPRKCVMLNAPVSATERAKYGANQWVSVTRLPRLLPRLVCVQPHRYDDFSGLCSYCLAGAEPH